MLALSGCLVPRPSSDPNEKSHSRAWQVRVLGLMRGRKRSLPRRRAFRISRDPRLSYGGFLIDLHPGLRARRASFDETASPRRLDGKLDAQ